jgi:glycosyltransferase involved in cell wall biosynthesis
MDRRDDKRWRADQFRSRRRHADAGRPVNRVGPALLPTATGGQHSQLGDAEGADPLKILALTAHYPPHHGGGYGLQFQLFCEGLAGRGHDVYVVCSRPDGWIDEGDAALVHVSRALCRVPAAAGAGTLLRRTLHNAGAVRRGIREFGPDVLLCGGMDGVGFNTYRAAIGSGVPALTWLGDTWLGQAWRDLRAYDAWADLAVGGRRPGLRRLVKRAIGAYGRWRGLFDSERPNVFGPVAALSHFVLDDLRHSAAPVPDGAKVIPTCLHSAFLCSPNDVVGHGGVRTRRLRALFVGRMERLKGPDVAVCALAQAVAIGADVRLTFAGLLIDQARPELEAKARALGVADRIIWAGSPCTNELVELYRAHDVFLFPSRVVEGLGVVNCEALACGLPVIGTAHSGSAEVIVPGETGYRVDKDDAAAMGERLAELHADRPLLERFSKSATRFARRYLPDTIVGQLEAELLRVRGGMP